MTSLYSAEAVCGLLPYFAAASLFPAYADSWTVVGAVLLLVIISSLILEKFKSPPARVICGLLPALGLFAARSTAHILFTIPALLIWCILVLFGKNRIYYEDYKYWFGIPAALALIMLIVSLSRAIAHLSVSTLSVVCSSAYIALGIVVLRGKRLGEGAGARTRALNVLEPVAAASCGVAACAALWGLIYALRKLFEILIYPVGMILGGVARLFSWIAGHIFIFGPDTESVETETSAALETGVQAPESPKPDTAAKNYDWAETVGRLAVILLIVAVAALLIFIVYKAVKRVKNGGAADPLYEETLRESRDRGRARRKKRERDGGSNSYKIRKIYREYLTYIRLNGVKIGRQTTSEEALAASRQLAESDEAAELRALYIRARYNDRDKLTDDDVRRAAELWDAIRREYEAKKAGGNTVGS